MFLYALAVEPLIDDTTSKQPLSTTVETTVDIKSQTTERGEKQNDEQSNQNVAIPSNRHLMGSEIDKKLDTVLQMRMMKSLTCVIKKQVALRT